jgi:Lrp/AsnC family transcriptional regulator, leucine-responsive regulatory protein
MKKNIILTLADKKILSLIEYNPRITFKELATACHLSKDTIKYRIARLEKEKIILGYTAYIDYKKLGNQSYKLFIKLNASLEQKEKFKDFLRKQKNVFSIFESNGNWNLAVAIFAKNHVEYHEIENSILENFGDLISNIRFCSMIDAQIFHKDFFKQGKAIKSFNFWGELDSQKLDELDKKLIKLIHKNSKTSLVDLSEDLKLSIDATKNRLKKLSEKNILKIYKTSINYSLLGFSHHKILIFPKNYSTKSEAEIINFLKNSKNCINIIRTIGPWKLEAEFLIENLGEIDKITSELNEKYQKEISDIEISLIKNEELFACKDLLLE